MKKPKDLLLQLGALALATRLKRLSEILQNDVSKLYKEHHLNFEARWFTLLYLVYHKKETTVVNAAKALGLTHPAIVQLIEQLQEAKLIRTEKSKDDARKRLISITNKGIKTFEEIQPLLKKIEKANMQLINQSGDVFLESLTEIEKLLKEKSMYERVKTFYKKDKLNK